ncbi:MAG: polysaccharide deacetylase family protein [Ignavibacterium sp.]|nr:polysaccharide deacetylase family protein [Ignavibacterium sp.]MCX7612519.1 polysaccharide deacetylase family protein [Ignavibacterium sp.]MDW8374923.1 polysaccharide deacetylase family protein [Ignavibacteriales bacterium]
MEVVERKYGLRVNFLLLLIGGLVMLIASALIFLLIIRGIFGVFEVNDIIPKNFFGLFGKPKPQVAILHSKYTQNMLPKGNTWILDNINTWKKYLSNINLSADVIGDEDIEMGKHFDYKLLILPGSKSLSEKEIIQIKKYLEKGGAVFATSGTGSFSDDGKWKGWDFINETFGIRFTRELSRDESYLIHTLRGSLPLTAEIPAGFALKVATWDRPVAVEVLDPRTTQVSYWFNIKKDRGLVRQEIKETAGIVYGTFGDGKFVWYGFEINSIIGVNQEHLYFEKLFNNSINWLLSLPVSVPKIWQSDFKAGAIFLVTLDNKLDNLDNLIPIIQKNNIPITFLVDPQIALSDSSRIKNIAQYGELAAIVDIGYINSWDDTDNKLYNQDEQTKKIKEAKEIIEKVSGKKVFGMMPKFGLFDQNTIFAAIKNNLKYLIADSILDRSVPNIVIKGKDKIVVFSRTARDDYEVIRDYGLEEPAFQFYTYQEDIDRLLFESGLLVFNFHPEYQLQSKNVNVIEQIHKDIEKKNFQINYASAISNWYDRKEIVQVKAEQRGKYRISLKISNPGDRTIENYKVDIDLNRKVKNVSLGSEIIGLKPVKFEHSEGSNIIYITIDKLKPGESRVYFLDYEVVS